MSDMLRAVWSHVIMPVHKLLVDSHVVLVVSVFVIAESLQSPLFRILGRLGVVRTDPEGFADLQMTPRAVESWMILAFPKRRAAMGNTFI